MAARNDVQNSGAALDAEITAFKHLSRQLEHPADRASFLTGVAGASGTLMALKEPSEPYSILTVAEAPMARARAAAMTAVFIVGE